MGYRLSKVFVFVPSYFVGLTVMIGCRKLCTKDQIFEQSIQKRFLSSDNLIVCTRHKLVSYLAGMYVTVQYTVCKALCKLSAL